MSQVPEELYRGLGPRVGRVWDGSVHVEVRPKGH